METEEKRGYLCRVDDDPFSATGLSFSSGMVSVQSFSISGQALQAYDAAQHCCKKRSKIMGRCPLWPNGGLVDIGQIVIG